MRVVSCNYEIDKYAGVYLETVLNGLSEKLLSGLVRDVDRMFLNMKVVLPVTEDEQIDFAWMSEFVKKREDIVIHHLVEKYQNHR